MLERNRVFHPPSSACGVGGALISALALMEESVGTRSREHAGAQTPAGKPCCDGDENEPDERAKGLLRGAGDWDGSPT